MTATRKTQPEVDSQSLLLDGLTPVAAYDAVRRTLPGVSFLLESAPAPQRCARYSIIGFGALAELRAGHGEVRVRLSHTQAHFPATDLLAACRYLRDGCTPQGEQRQFLGAYGVAAFELAGYFEELNLPADRAGDLPDLHLVVPEGVVVFDHFTHLVNVCVLRHGNSTLAIADILSLMRCTQLKDVELPAPRRRTQPSEANYCRGVRGAQEAIAAGDAFQIVLSQAWTLHSAADPFAVYRSLRSLNPSPYMFFLDFGWGQLFGSSPEALCRLDGRRARVRPLAGTRPRPLDRGQEPRVVAELQRDAKERAEHVMLVDLARNDLGRVCEYGSVDVADLFSVERFSHVMHLASQVQGRLRADCDAFDLFAATFPAGTVSGAPKIRAMQLIAQLEGVRRGPYGGSIAYFGFDGSLDACITLRSACVRSGVYSVRAGAGIVADSIAAHENAECQAKAGAVLEAMQPRPAVTL